MLKAILSDEYSVLEAENGQVALDILETKRRISRLSFWML